MGDNFLADFDVMPASITGDTRFRSEAQVNRTKLANLVVRLRGGVRGDLDASLEVVRRAPLAAATEFAELCEYLGLSRPVGDAAEPVEAPDA